MRKPTKPRNLFWKTRTEQYDQAIVFSAEFENFQASPEVVIDINTYTICKEFGWKLEYVRGLDMFEFHQILGTINGWRNAQRMANRQK